MRIRYVRGDLLKTPARFILHGCNAQGVMGAGVAAAIRDRYPAAYAAYRKRFETVGLRVGDAIWVACGGRVIINAITQERYGRSGVFVDYDAIASVMREIDRSAGGAVDHEGRKLGPVMEVAMPLIGAGLAGGSWGRISRIIEDNLNRVHPLVYTLDGRIPR